MTNQTGEMVIPHDPDAEASLLATLAAPWHHEQTYQMVGELDTDLFLVPQNQLVFAAIRSLAKQGQDITLVTLKAELDRAGLLNRAGSTDHLVDLLNSEEVRNPRGLVLRLQELRTRRMMLRLGDQASRQAIDEGTDPNQAILELRDSLNKLLTGVHSAEASTADKAMALADEGKPFWLPGRRYAMGLTGIDGFDEQVVIPAAEPVFLCARPGCGKTALALQIAVESVIQMDAKPLFVSLELTEPKLLARFAAHISGVSGDTWRKGSYTSQDKDRLRAGAKVLSGISTLFPDQGTPWSKIEGQIRRLIDKKGIDLVLIDYFGYLGRVVAKGSSEAYAFAANSEAITAFAKNTTVGCVVLHQLKGESDGAQGKRPRLSDIGDSDRPARDASVVMMLWRDNSDITWLTVPKNRDGVPGRDYRLNFEGSTGRFSRNYQTTGEQKGGGLWK